MLAFNTFCMTMHLLLVQRWTEGAPGKLSDVPRPPRSCGLWGGPCNPLLLHPLPHTRPKGQQLPLPQNRLIPEGALHTQQMQAYGWGVPPARTPGRPKPHPDPLCECTARARLLPRSEWAAGLDRGRHQAHRAVSSQQRARLSGIRFQQMKRPDEFI